MYSLNSNSELNILCWNAQSIFNKQIEFFEYLIEKNIHIAILTETWLKSHKAFYHPKFVCIRADRNDEEHGGTAIVILRCIKHTILKSIKTRVIESVAIAVESPTGPIKIIGAYFPHSRRDASMYNHFQEDIRKLTSVSGSFFVCGDFNSKHRFWNCCRGNKPGNLLYNEMLNRNFTIHFPNSPTYFPTQSRFTNPSTLDIVLTNQMHNISQIITSDSLYSDHLAIEFSITTTLQINISSTNRPNYSNADWRAFKRNIDANIDLLNLQLNNHESIDNKISELISIIKSAETYSIPLIKNSPKKVVQLTDEIKHLISTRNMHRRRWQRSGNVYSKLTFKSINCTIQSKIFELKNKHFGELLTGLNFASKKFWRVTKLIKNKSNILPPLISTVFSASHINYPHI